MKRNGEALLEPKGQAATQDSDNQRIPLRAQAAVYTTGAFSASSEHVVNVIVPLWALSLGASPFMIGVIVGARHFLTMLLSIHGGAVMDRIGARRVLLFFGAVAATAPLLFPTFPTVWSAVVLQMILGLATNLGWMGAQSQIGEIMRGSTLYAGRLSFTVRFGHLAAGPAAGFAWDVAGPWAGFSVLSLWGMGALLAAVYLPQHKAEPGRRSGSAAAFLPRLGDYIDAFRLIAIPTVLLVVIISVLRMAGNGIQSSFYVIYLQKLGYTGTLIGLLVSASAVLGFVGALSVAPLSRIISRTTLLLICVIVSILAVSITPLIGGAFILLVIASALRGGSLGLSQPLMITVLASSAGAGNQGKAIGLRTTANRIISMVIPIMMGGVVEVAGLEASFLIMGTILIILTLLAARLPTDRPDAP